MSEIDENKDIKLSETISLSKAATILGYDSFRSVKELIKRKKLKGYKTSFSRNTRVLKSEVDALTIMEEVEG
jgi:hypothetical protein